MDIYNLFPRDWNKTLGKYKKKKKTKDKKIKN